MLRAVFAAGLRLCGLTAALLAVSLLLGHTLPAGAQIAYTQRADSTSIRLIDVERLLSTRLVNVMRENPTSDGLPTWSPVWSPDGESVAFLSTHTDVRSFVVAVYILSDLGSAPRIVATNPYDDPPLVWSPDGRRIALSLGDRENGMPGIYSANADGSGLTRLTSSGDWGPQWSSDGASLAFQSYRDGNGEIYMLRNLDGELDGDESWRVTFDDATDANPVWSPDGTRLAFVSVRDGNQEIYIVDSPQRQAADAEQGSIPNPPFNLTRHPSNDGTPVWSPDGTRIAFVSWRSSSRDIYVVDTRGGLARPITFSANEEITPAWSPDGRYIAYVAWEMGSPEIYIIEVEAAFSGSATPHRLTYNHVEDLFPAWRP